MYRSPISVIVYSGVDFSTRTSGQLALNSSSCDEYLGNGAGEGRETGQQEKASRPPTSTRPMVLQLLSLLPPQEWDGQDGHSSCGRLWEPRPRVEPTLPRHGVHAGGPEREARDPPTSSRMTHVMVCMFGFMGEQDNTTTRFVSLYSTMQPRQDLSSRALGLTARPIRFHAGIGSRFGRKKGGCCADIAIRLFNIIFIVSLCFLSIVPTPCCAMQCHAMQSNVVCRPVIS